MGGPSITVQEWPPAGPVFQACRPVSVAGYGHGSRYGNSQVLGYASVLARMWHGPRLAKRAVVDLGHGSVALLPWPPPGGLDLEREAQEGADEDDRGQYRHAGQVGRGGDGTDDVAGHKQLQAEQDQLQAASQKRLEENKRRFEEGSAALETQILALEKQKADGERELETLRAKARKVRTPAKMEPLPASQRRRAA